VRACEEYCRRQGYEILERFSEEGESAKTTDRSQLQNLLKYCRTRKGEVHFVVVYNLTRFAREKYDHFALRAHLKSLGISLRSATEPIDDTSTGKLMEGVLASFAQFDNDVRSDRTRAGMRAALELGRWTFPAPIGYLNAPKWSGKSLVPDPERAPLIARAFEELATGRFTKQEVITRMTEAGLRTRRGLVLSPQSFGQMVRNSIYVGRVESPDYGVSTRGDFEPLIDEATFYRVQAVLDGRVVVAGPRPRNHPDFPLRGFVRCETCGRPLTGAGRRAATAITRTTTASGSAGPSTSARRRWKGPSSMSSHCCSQRLATCGWSRIESSACGSSVGLKRRTGRRSSNGV
jgi:DNA invertase Pin-like site-specific DNA recombinase